MWRKISLICFIFSAIIQVNAQTVDSLLIESEIPAGYSVDNGDTKIPYFDDNSSPFQMGFLEFPGTNPAFGFSIFNFPQTPVLQADKANLNALNIGSSMSFRQYFTVQSDLLGYYRQGMFRVNNKFSLYSATILPEKNFGATTFGNYPQLNYGTSFEVGYKFSDKFSIRAGFSVGSYDYPY
jgi:hypothetical protein